MEQTIHILADSVGKKFYQRWIFKSLSFDLPFGQHLLIKGANGSGKSTLLRIIAGQLSPSTGKIQYRTGDTPLAPSVVYSQISWSSPATELFPDLTLREHVNLHYRFKPCLLDSTDAIIQQLRLSPHKDKALGFFSSGMLQRVKVGLALFSKSPVLLLDEPTSFMDEENSREMLELIRKFTQGRTYILASNKPIEWEGFSEVMQL